VTDRGGSFGVFCEDLAAGLGGEVPFRAQFIKIVSRCGLEVLPRNRTTVRISGLRASETGGCEQNARYQKQPRVVPRSRPAQAQPLGLLAWAACGKDPGFSPASILEEARRTARYSDVEIQALDFGGQVPDMRELAHTWKAQLESARLILEILPAEEAGRAVLDSTGRLFRGGPDDLRHALVSNQLIFHPGSIRGAFPCVAQAPA
jgi:hypothetical protein